MSKIFISYRRDDSADVTGRINDRLREHFGENAVFTDVDNIPLGEDFRIHIDSAVSRCDVLLAVIGKDWVTAQNADNEFRINDPTDFVRIEIETAMSREIPVIPLLVRGAIMPETDDLPESLHDLVFRNAQKIRPDPDFKSDANRLVHSLVMHFQSDTSETPLEEILGQDEGELSIRELARQQSLRRREELKRVRGQKKREAMKWGRTAIGFLRLMGIVMAFMIATSITPLNDFGENGLLGSLLSIVSFGVVAFFWWRVSPILVWRNIDRWLNP